MEQTKFYLVTTLIEYSDNVSDGHALYRNIEDAEKAMRKEIEDCRENFDEASLETVASYKHYEECRTEDGFGYTVGIEEMALL